MTGARLWEVAENVLGGGQRSFVCLRHWTQLTVTYDSDAPAFPSKGLPKESVVVDIGGGIGSTSVVLATAYPHLRFVVQDREQVVGIAPLVRLLLHATARMYSH